MDSSARPGRERAIEPTQSAGREGDARPPPGGPPRPAIVGLGVIAAIVAIILAVILLQPQPDPVGEASPSPTTSGPSEPTEAAPSATAEATPEPTATAVPKIAEAWTEAAVFSEPGKRYVLGDLVAWSGGFVAAGTLYEQEARNVFGPPPPHAGVVWRSTDGNEWTDARPAVFDGIELTHLFETADGALIVIGNTYPEIDAVSAAWETNDGETWTPVELAGVPEGASVLQVASGAQGHIASTYVGADAHPLYSADGRAWQPTLTEGVGITAAAAGDEGFVVSAFSTEPEGTATQILASANGLEWLEATTPWDGGFLAAPRGGDWVATTTVFATHGEPAADVTTWQSVNGLDWSALGEMDLASGAVDGGPCLESPGILHGLTAMVVAGTLLSGPCSEGAVIAAGGSYASLDGAEWTRLPFGDHAFAAGAARLGDRVVIATDARTNQADVIGVMFWISESP